MRNDINTEAPSSAVVPTMPDVAIPAGDESQNASPGVTLKDILAEADDLVGADLDDIKALLSKAVSLGLSPGDMAVMNERVAKATKLKVPTLSKIALDIENDHNGRVLHSPRSVAEAVTEELATIYSQAVHSEGRFYLYREPVEGADDPESGYFSGHSHDELRDYLAKACWGKPAVSSKSQRREAIELVAAKLDDPHFFADARKGVNVRNGFLQYDPSANAVQLLPLSQEHRARSRLPVEWQPDARPASLLAGLNRVLPDVTAQGLVQEFLGCAVLGLRPPRDLARNVLMLIGDRNSGKSTLMGLLRLLLPSYAVAAVPPHLWSQDYHRAMLNGVAANLVTELDVRTPIRAAQLKAVGSCEPVTARLPYQDPFQFTPVAKHIFAANSVPRVDDTHDAVERRLATVMFNHGLRPDEVDPRYAVRLKAELPGALAWVVDGALRAMERGRYELPAAHRAIVYQMQHGNELQVEFVTECIEAAGPNDRPLAARDLHAAYKRFLAARGIDTEGVTEVTDARRRAAVLKALFDIEQSKNQGHPIYRGIRLKNNA